MIVATSALAIVALGVSFQQCVKRIPAGFIYCVTTEFGRMPPDDKALESWLTNQPGVFKVMIQRKEKELEITLGQTRNGFGEPPFPDLNAKCDELGYEGKKGPFRDCPR